MSGQGDKKFMVVLLVLILWLMNCGTVEQGVRDKNGQPSPQQDGHRGDSEVKNKDVHVDVKDEEKLPHVIHLGTQDPDLKSPEKEDDSVLHTQPEETAEQSAEPSDASAQPVLKDPDNSITPGGGAPTEESGRADDQSERVGEEQEVAMPDSNLPSTPEEFLQVGSGEADSEGAAQEAVVQQGQEPQEPEQPTAAPHNPEPASPGPAPDASQVAPLPPSTDTPQEATDKARVHPNQGVQPPGIVVEDVTPPADAEEQKDEVAPPSRKEDMPSFDEWKQKMLAQQAEEEKIKQQDLQAQASQPTNGAQTKNKPKTNRVNFASATCGAKLLSTNPEAQKKAFVLSENKDQYMINPCKARKWFVVELCEPIQVQAIEMGNLELFSSVPESFRVQVSDRYPTKEWTVLGTFHARDERSMQTFPVKDEVLFVKYLKIEMLSHFGSEHYCPITLIRVFGITVEDDDVDEAPETESSDSEEDIEDMVADSLTASTDEPSNLFASATDTVLSLVKQVLTPGEKEDGEQLKDDVVSLKGQKGNTSNLNVTEEEVAEVRPCTPDAKVDGTPQDPSASQPPDQPQAPDVLTPAPSEPDQNGQPTRCPNGPVVQDDPSLVILIERPGVSVRSLLDTCDPCLSTHTSQHNLCAYYSILHQPQLCCPSQSHRDDVKVKLKSPQEVEPSLPLKGSSTTEHSSVHLAPSTQPARDSVISPTPVLTTPVSSSLASSVAPSVEPVLPSSETQHVDSSLASSMTPEENAPTETSTPATEATEVTPTSCDDKQLNTDCMGPDVVQIRPTPTEEVATATDFPSDEEEDEGEEDTDSAEDTPEVENHEGVDPIPEKQPPQLNLTNGDKDIYAEDGPYVDSDLELENIAPPSDEEMQYQKLTSGKKETTYMRLKNRIKALEIHLNLSSRYLEELSQRYKREMDEMHSSLNRTISKLSNNSRSAAETDERQQDEIEVLKETLVNLTAAVSSMQETMDNAQKQLMERHLYLMLAEAAIFIAIIAWCTSHNHHYTQPIPVAMPPRVMTPITAKHKPPDSKKPFTKGHRRHKSIDSPARERSGSGVVTLAPRSRDDSDLIKTGSDTDVTVIEPNIPLFLTNDLYKAVAKKKKKKKLQRQSLSHQGACPASSLTRSSSTSALSTSQAAVRPSDSASSQVSSSSSGASLNGNNNSAVARNLLSDFARSNCNGTGSRFVDTLRSLTCGNKKTKPNQPQASRQQQNGSVVNGGVTLTQNGDCSRPAAQPCRHAFGHGKG